uniref:Uncharacterized protein n=1 Tax=Rhizophora mucronata TaxID=61149 RepID=A0A2P2PWR4_RHIMU
MLIYYEILLALMYIQRAKNLHIISGATVRNRITKAK